MEEQKIIYIYGLINPLDENDLRYIGKTDNLKRRIKEHVNDAKKCKNNNWKNNWIRKLLNENIRPTIIVIDEIEEINWDYYEIFYIDLFRSFGFNLTNTHIGGSAPPPRPKGTKCSEETRKKMSKAQKGKKLTEDQIRQMSESRKDKPPSWWFPGWKHTEETKQKLSGLKKGKQSINKGKKLSKETRQKISDSRHKKPVKQIDNNNSVVKIWSSMREIEKILKINHNNISKCCRHVKHYNTAGGFKWEFVNENDYLINE